MQNCAEIPVGRPAGRPSKYTEALAERILELVRAGVPMHEIEKKPWAPSRIAVYRWECKNVTFRNALSEAREASAHALADSALEIIDGFDDDDTSVKVARATQRAGTRKWLASKRNAAAYGDRTRTEVTGSDGGPVQVSDDGELAKKLAFILALGRRSLT